MFSPLTAAWVLKDALLLPPCPVGFIFQPTLCRVTKGTDSAAPIQSDEEDEGKQPNCLLLEPDFHLMQALMESQQNFTISDPSVPDNPIVYASQVRIAQMQEEIFFLP